MEDINSNLIQPLGVFQDLSKWDVSSITDMSKMFTNSSSFTTTGGISWSWDNVVSNQGYSFIVIDNLKLNKNLEEEFSKKFTEVLSNINNILYLTEVLEKENTYKNLFNEIKKTEALVNYQNKFNTQFNIKNPSQEMTKLKSLKEMFYNAHV